MDKCKVLLLGGSGFIGGALAKKLALEGHEVLVLSPRPPAVATHCSYVQGSLDDPSLLAGLLPQCRTVFHLASATNPGSSARSPARELDNLAPTLRLLEMLEAWPEIHLVFFSSGGTVYGNPQRLPAHEDDATRPLSYHGAGKVAQEAVLQVFRSCGHTVTILRPSNAYGPGQELKNRFGLVRTLLEHARCGTTFEVWGDGESVRDYIYIDDVTEACSRLIKIPQNNDTYNLGSGIGYSINQVRQIVEEITGIQIKTVYRPARGIDVRNVVLDNSRINQALSWEPKTELQDGIRLTWEKIRCLYD